MSRTFPRPARSVTFGALVLLLLQPFAEVAAAANLTWLNAAGGSAATAANWNPAAVPAPVDVLRYDMASTYTVTFPAAVESVSTHQLWGGDVTLDCTVAHGVRTAFNVASLAGQVATARLTSGTLRSGWGTSIGAGTGATGTLRVSGAGTDFTQNVVGAIAGFPMLNIGGAGTVDGGHGDLIIRNGGQVQPAYRMNIGLNPGSVGTLSVRGEGVLNSVRRRSSLIADSTASDAFMGLSGAHGIIEVLDGGLVRIGRTLSLAQAAGDTAEITIGGAGVIDSSRIRVKGDLRVSVNPSAAVGAAGGVATIELDSLGVLVVDDSTVVGDPDGSTALITLHPSSRMMTKHLILQQNGAASMDLQGGMLQVNGGTLATSTGRLEFPGGTAIGYPTIELMSGTNATFTGTTANPPLVVGQSGHAEMYVSGGSLLAANGGTPILGQGAGSVGKVFVRNGGELSSDHRFIAGQDGVGILDVYNDGVLSGDGLDVGPGTSGGFLTVSSGGLVSLSGALNVAGSLFAPGAGGNVQISAGGQVDVTAPLLAGTIWPDGLLLVRAGGVLDLAGVMTVRGDLIGDGGAVTGGALALRDAGRIAGAGNIASTILGGADTTATIFATGVLHLGNELAGGGILMRGTTDVTTATVTLSDPDSAVLGTVLMGGGLLTLPPGGAVIEAGRRLIGEGTVMGSLTPRGYVIANGSGLRFVGPVHGTGQGMSGGVIRFGGGGSFEGSGTIAAQVMSDPGSLIRSSGSLTLGNFSAANMVFNGRIESGPELMLRPLNLVQLGGELVLQGPVATTAPIQVVSSGKISGSGFVLGSIIVGGTFAPGASAGRVTVFGNVNFDLGIYAADLGNHATGEADTLEVLGNTVLGGTLALHRLPSFAAAGGDSFRVLSYFTRIGSFNLVTLDGLPLTTDMAVHYNSDGVWVIVSGNVAVGDPPTAAAIGPLRLAALGSPGRGPALELSLPDASQVALAVFDLQGRQVATLQNGPLNPGRHHFDLGRHLPDSGVYFARATIADGANTTVKTVRVVRMR